MINKKKRGVRMKSLLGVNRIVAISMIVFLVVFSASCSSTGTGGGGEPTGPDEIRIGMIGPLTGPVAQYGNAMKTAIELAVEEINNDGGILGAPVKLIIEDDASVPSQSVSAAEKLCTQDEVHVVIAAYNSSCVLAHMEVTRREGVPQINPIATADAITKSGNDFIFRNCATNPMQVNQLANYVFENMDLDRFAILHENTDYGIGIAESFIEAAQKAGKEIITVETYNPGDTDFYAQLTKIKELNPDGMLMGGNLTEGSQITKQARELGLDVQKFGMGGLSSPEFDNLAEGSNEGMIVTSYFELNTPNPLAREFIENYHAKWGKYPDMFAAATYEAMYIAKAAIENAEYTDDLAQYRINIRDAIRALDELPGVQGPTTFDASGQADKQVLVVQWKNHDKVILFPKN
jgi:branched-chain amino acid transport system substrate-binding protein